MSQTLIVVEDLKNWAPYYPSSQVLSFAEYLNTEHVPARQRVRVINLCGEYPYLSDGYYCSLLAEARGHHVIPSVSVLNDLSKRALYQIQLGEMSKSLEQALKQQDKQDTLTLRFYFGTSPNPEYRDLARRLFERFPCPILEVKLRFRKQWEISGLNAGSPNDLDDEAESDFANALDEFSQQVWRKTPSKKKFRFDLAMLVNPEEKLPPSDKQALKKFIQAGSELGVDVEIITQRNFLRLPEYDGLFIRETTAVDHHTYRFAKKAEAENMVVVDDPTSILRCANKVYLADLFRSRNVPTPKTMLLHRGNKSLIEQLEARIDYPIVIKIPDGSFSRGIVKVKNRDELKTNLKTLFQKSALVLAQEFFYTDFDWRIGIFNNRPLYACRYYMVKDHWQIYNHGANRVDSGGFETLPTFEVPQKVLQAALAATQPIGDGLYGVDVKEKDGKGYVIEVNDNPNIDKGVEDRYLGDELYRLIMGEFVRRMELHKT